MRKPPQSSALGPTVAESLTAAIARRQGAGHDRAAAAVAPGLPGACRGPLNQETQKASVRPERISWWRRIGRRLVGLVVVLAGWLWLLPPA